MRRVVLDAMNAGWADKLSNRYSYCSTREYTLRRINVEYYKLKACDRRCFSQKRNCHQFEIWDEIKQRPIHSHLRANCTQGRTAFKEDVRNVWETARGHLRIGTVLYNKML